MRSQSPQRRYLRWMGVLMVLAMLVAVPVVVAANHYQQGLVDQCAEHFEEDKSALARLPLELVVAAGLGVRVRKGWAAVGAASLVNAGTGPEKGTSVATAHATMQVNPGSAGQERTR
jgi:hypothetical protein